MAPISLDAYETIRERVLTGDLPPGTRLVNRTLGKEIGTSHVPVREALHRLVSDGLAEHIPGAGTFVRTLSAEDLSQLYALRECLECFAVKEACARAADWQIKSLRAKLAQGRQLLEKVRNKSKDTFSLADPPCLVSPRTGIASGHHRSGRKPLAGAFPWSRSSCWPESFTPIRSN